MQGAASLLDRTIRFVRIGSRRESIESLSKRCRLLLNRYVVRGARRHGKDTDQRN